MPALALPFSGFMNETSNTSGKPPQTVDQLQIGHHSNRPRESPPPQVNATQHAAELLALQYSTALKNKENSLHYVTHVRFPTRRSVLVCIS
jgi:hypothetical protein